MQNKKKNDKSIRLLKNKKGFFDNLVVIITLILAFAVAIFIFHYFINATIDKFRVSDINQSSEARLAMSYGESATGLLDTFMVIMIFGGLIGIIIYSFLVPSHPVYVIPFIIMLILAIIVSIPLSDMYQNLYNTPSLNSTAKEFSMTAIVLTSLPTYTLIAGAMGTIVLFAKRRSEVSGMMQ